MLFSPNCYQIVILSGNQNGYYHFPPQPGPLRGYLTPSCMEDYFVVEFLVSGGETEPLSLSIDLGYRHLLGSCLRPCRRGTTSALLAKHQSVYVITTKCKICTFKHKILQINTK